jgi:hypothetical protein
MATSCSSEAQFQRDIKRPKTYELEASEENKNIQAAAEFWAVMRQTHGFQNQPTGIQAQAEAANEVAPSTEPESPSRQPAETLLESLGNTKRSRRSDEEYTTSTNHPLDTIPARPAKRRKKFTCDYANPITTDTPQGDTPTRAQETHDIVSLTDTPRSQPNTKKCIQVGSETYAAMSQPRSRYTKRRRGSDEEYTKLPNHPLDTIPATPAKEFTGDYANPITTATPQVDTPTRDKEAHDIVSLTDTPRSHPDTKKCIQIGSETYAVTSQPGTPYTFDPGIDTGTLQGQRLQPVTNPACDDYDSIVVLDPSGPPDHVHSGKKKRLQYRVRKKMHTNTSNSDRTTP